MYQRVLRKRIRNRTLHIEKHWLRAALVGLPFDVGIDYQTLAVPIELD